LGLDAYRTVLQARLTQSTQEVSGEGNQALQQVTQSTCEIRNTVVFGILTEGLGPAVGAFLEATALRLSVRLGPMMPLLMDVLTDIPGPEGLPPLNPLTQKTIGRLIQAGLQAGHQTYQSIARAIQELLLSKPVIIDTTNAFQGAAKAAKIPPKTLGEYYKNPQFINLGRNLPRRQ
jgi:hypothetical protein